MTRATTSPDPLDRFRRPEYTGENRCVPCTVVNVAIAVLVAGGVAVLASTRLGTATGAVLGGVLFLLFAATISLRGYLVPGTPALTKAYFPDWLLRRFDKHPAAGREAPDGEFDVEAELKHIGAAEECESRDDICLTEGFRSAWCDRILALREQDTTRADLAAVLDTDPDRLTFREHGDALVAELDGRRVGQWESRAAFLADMAGAGELRARHDRWSGMDVDGRTRMLNGLRIFLDRCPSCDGRVLLDQEVVESCCRSIDVVTVACEDCGARLFETELPG